MSDPISGTGLAVSALKDAGIYKTTSSMGTCCLISLFNLLML